MCCAAPPTFTRRELDERALVLCRLLLLRALLVPPVVLAQRGDDVAAHDLGAALLERVVHGRPALVVRGVHVRPQL